jgi:hypothetical protein
MRLYRLKENRERRIKQCKQHGDKVAIQCSTEIAYSSSTQSKAHMGRTASLRDIQACAAIKQ